MSEEKKKPVSDTKQSQDNFTVDSGNQASTAKVPIQPQSQPQPVIKQPQPEPETKTIFVQILPLTKPGVPVRVPKDVKEPPEEEHAGENEGAQQGLGGR